MEYLVTRQHWGDMQYFEGDTRTVTVKGDAEQLIKMGLIAEQTAKRAAPTPKNKMAKAPANKAE